jgi:hypothetical protein
MEILNELFIIVDCYFLFLFTDFVQDYQTRYTLGWGLSLHLAFLLLMNLSVVTFKTVV